MSSITSHETFLLSIRFSLLQAAGLPTDGFGPRTPHRANTTARQQRMRPPRFQQSAALKLPLKNPRIVVNKSKRGWSSIRMARWFALTKLVWDSIRFQTTAQGDRATPEGEFYVFTKNDKSAFYLSLGHQLSKCRRRRARLARWFDFAGQHDAIVKAIKRKATPPQNTALGGDIYIHGNGASSDWTWGCVALENEDMKELFDAVPVGTPVTIKP